MKICIISVCKDDYAPKRIFEEAKKMGHKPYITTWSDIIFELNQAKVYIGDKRKSLDGFDAIIPRSPNYLKRTGNIKINRKYGMLLRLIIAYAKIKKIFVLNSDFFQNYWSNDKLAQQFFLFQNRLPGISTYHFSSLSRLKSAKIIRYPIIIKKIQGSRGTGVFRAENKKELLEMIKKYKIAGSQILFQKYYPIKYDFRVLVVGGKSIGTMKRLANGNEWRTNVALGGKATSVSLKESVKIEQLAEKVAKKMKFSYVGVDILESGGKFYIIEVNSLAQFQGFEKANPKVNVARSLILEVEKKVKILKR